MDPVLWSKNMSCPLQSTLSGALYDLIMELLFRPNGKFEWLKLQGAFWPDAEAVRCMMVFFSHLTLTLSGALSCLTFISSAASVHVYVVTPWHQLLMAFVCESVFDMFKNVYDLLQYNFFSFCYIVYFKCFTTSPKEPYVWKPPCQLIWG